MRGKNNTTQTHRNSIKSGYCLNDKKTIHESNKNSNYSRKCANCNYPIFLMIYFWCGLSIEVVWSGEHTFFIREFIDGWIDSHSTLATKRIRCLIQFTSNKSRQIQQIKLTQTSQTERLSNVANSKANIMDMNGSECYASEILRWAPVFDLEICFTTIPTAERSDRIVCVCVCVVFRIWMNMYRACERTKYECFKLVAE